MEESRFWLILGGIAWLAVAIAIFRWILARPGSRVLDRGAGARCIFGALLGVALLELLLGMSKGASDAPPAFAFLAVHAGMAAFVIGFAARVQPLQEVMGVEPRRAPWDVVKGVAIYLAFAPVVVAVHLLNSWLVGVSADEAQKPVRDRLTQEGPGRAVLILTLVVAVPLFEEIVFRGLLQQGIKAQLACVMRERSTRVLSIVVASVLFTVLHPTPAYLPVFILSLLLGAAYDRSGQILVPAVIHASHNLAVVLYETLATKLGSAA